MGSDDPAVDAEVIQAFVEIERRAGVRHTSLELNSIGDRECRPAYVERLRAFLDERRDDLDEDTRRRADVSPLRVFDTKSEPVRRVLAEAPTIGESLCEPCREHFAEVRSFLDAYDVGYELVPTLVRGLDYYTRTVFEFVNEDLGAAQSSICAGGRYDYLIEEIGGPPTPGIGWAAGVERMAASAEPEDEEAGIDLFVAFADRERRREILTWLVGLRRAGRRCDTDYAGRSLKGQLTQAGRLGARATLVVESDRLTLRRAGSGDIEVASREQLEELLG
jgi:histidyl-tRNA synthetase